MRKIAVLGLVAILLPAAAFGQSRSELESRLAELLRQVAELQAQIAKVSGGASQGGTGGSVQAAADQPVSISHFKKDLRFGLAGDEAVSDLQSFLREQGFYAGPVSGNFFSLTQEGVKKFQAANGLPATGYFGPLSRGKANAVRSSIARFICPENGCPGPIPPVPSLWIRPESDLTGQTGRDFRAVFRVGGGLGHYDIEASGEIPGLLWSRSSNCLPNGMCTLDLSADSITLAGTPAKAGVYRVDILARETMTETCRDQVCPMLYPMPRYGKTSFTVVIRGEGQAGAPVIHGVKGPTRLRAGEEGIWSIQASDPQDGVLSYTVRWGDESFNIPPHAAAAMPENLFFRQTATFSHAYSQPGEYKVSFRVANERGLVAETSLTVLVGEGGSTGPISVQALGPLAAGTGEWFSATVEAKGGVPPYRWAVTAGALPPGLELVQPPLPMIACPESARCPIPPQTTILLSGVPTQAGNYKFTLTAHDTQGNRGSGTFVMEVSNKPAGQGTLSIEPEYASIPVGGTVRLRAMYQPPWSCPPGLYCAAVMPAPYEVEADWKASDSSVVALERPAIQCITIPCVPPVYAKGLRAGSTEITAIYRTPAGVLTASAKAVAREDLVSQ